MNQTYSSIKDKNKLFADTAATLDPKTRISSSTNKRSSLRFERMSRDNIRLYSTIKCDEFEKSKFHRLDNQVNNFKWNNWKYTGFPIVSENFKKGLKIKVQRSFDNEKQKKIGPQELKIRHKIREVMKLKDDVMRAKQNNRLIQLIEDSHIGKIKTFFEQLEKHLQQ